MMDPEQILEQYWGYKTFRPLQKEIILSVLENHDTLALLPTGGGKSICFQVPALMKKGCCLVITPLISLMKDQVLNLSKRGIKAAAIYSGMHRNEIEHTMNNCIYGDTKLLYISPERLETEFFRQNIGHMTVSLLVVDEAHCISQWGYDFRPPYLNISKVREFIPSVPVLALTATATGQVVDDIMARLAFREQNFFQKSFHRENLTYYVIKEEDKWNRLLKIANNIKGSGIIYVRSRRKTKEIAEYLVKHKISAGFYHAGLSFGEREKKQNAWTTGNTRIIAATNAFGMGIDKPDVRFVVHMEIPDCIESYFQEAGRAGRDEKKAHAIMLCDKTDIDSCNLHYEQSFPEIKEIKNVYQALGNFLQVPVGGGNDLGFDFNLYEFSSAYRINTVIAYNALKFLEKEGYITLNEGLESPSRMHIKASKEDLYRLQVENPELDRLLKTILRSYSGIFNDFVKIDLKEISTRSGMDDEKIMNKIRFLEQSGVLQYIPSTMKPQVVYCSPRIDSKNIFISDENYRFRKEQARQRLDAILGYVTSSNKCRNQMLLAYFGEKNSKRCGFCDVCIEQNKTEVSELEFSNLKLSISSLLNENDLKIEDIISQLKADKQMEDKVIKALQWLIDNGEVEILRSWKLHRKA